MKSYREITADIEEYLGRRLTYEEEDYAYIMHITSGWGFLTGIEASTYSTWNRAKYLEGVDGISAVNSNPSGDGSPAAGDYRYIIKAGNPIQYQCIREAEANKYMGLLLVPDRAGKENCCVQFVGRKNKRIWITMQQAELIILDMVRGSSFAAAVDKNI